jgi:hypothetical protein
MPRSHTGQLLHRPTFSSPRHLFEVASFTPQLPYPQGKSPRHSLHRRMRRSRSHTQCRRPIKPSAPSSYNPLIHHLIRPSENDESITETSTRNRLGLKWRAAPKAGNLTAIYEATVRKMWDPRHLSLLQYVLLYNVVVKALRHKPKVAGSKPNKVYDFYQFT